MKPALEPLRPATGTNALLSNNSTGLIYQSLPQITDPKATISNSAVISAKKGALVAMNGRETY